MADLRTDPLFKGIQVGDIPELTAFAAGRPVFSGSLQGMADLTSDPIFVGLNVGDSPQLTGFSNGRPVFGPTTVSASPDAPPATPNPMDDEFNGSLNPAWAWYNQGANYVVTGDGWLELTGPVVPPDGTPGSGLFQPLPAAPWEFTAKVNFCGGDSSNNCGGITVMDSSTGHQTMLFRGSGNAISQGVGVLQPTLQWAADSPQPPIPTYLRVHDDGTTQTFSYSFDYQTWTVIYTQPRTTWTANPDRIGLAIYKQANGAAYLTVDWFRRTL